jgi:predicted O-methyltransferase YrrM
MFDLYNEVFKKARKRTQEFDAVENIRKKLLNDHSEINFINLGAGGTKHSESKRKLSQLTKSTSKKAKYARFLAGLAAYLKSKQVLELGTSVGISTLYMAQKNVPAQVTTIEGSPEVCRIAKEKFKMQRATNIHSIQGDFDQVLPQLLERTTYDFIYVDGNHAYDATKKYFDWFKGNATNETVIVFDDIYWSEGMTKAWEEIRKDDAVTASIDMFEFGIVFFRKELSKQHFVLRY